MKNGKRIFAIKKIVEIKSIVCAIQERLRRRQPGYSLILRIKTKSVREPIAVTSGENRAVTCTKSVIIDKSDPHIVLGFLSVIHFPKHVRVTKAKLPNIIRLSVSYSEINIAIARLGEKFR